MVFSSLEAGKKKRQKVLLQQKQRKGKNQPPAPRAPLRSLSPPPISPKRSLARDLSKNRMKEKERDGESRSLSFSSFSSFFFPSSPKTKKRKNISPFFPSHYSYSSGARRANTALRLLSGLLLGSGGFAIEGFFFLTPPPCGFLLLLFLLLFLLLLLLLFFFLTAEAAAAAAETAAAAAVSVFGVRAVNNE